jgi:hypothetical protein
MAGYSGFSKSNNAVAAEASGRHPATAAARLLGVPVAWVKLQPTREWHHTSSWYNSTDYYDLEQLAEHLATEEGQEQLAQVKAEAAAQKQKPETVIGGAIVLWIEWTGTRNHPRAVERREENATITDAGGKFVTVVLQDGTTFKKGKRTNGFRVFKDGKEIRF